ncbi:MAG TPA: class I poly(R)-hydroxyalkanoic acid synthase, partial [Burkholderiales bacterium]|nr:class I poly(R)-hydroxyalkanoic acid synthase [Burkholderiales bacterium]
MTHRPGVSSTNRAKPEAIPRATRAADPFGVAASFARVGQAWLEHPARLTDALAKLTGDLNALQLNAWQCALGLQSRPCVSIARDDERFNDPLWSELPFFSALKQFYLLNTHWLQETLYDTPGASAEDRRRATFWARQWLNAIAPTNYLLTNPVAIQKFWQSGGASLANGFQLWLEDLRVGDVQMVDRAAFKVGKNLATTPGAVVYRNELMELIQYAPSTPEVRKTPIVIIPPWINKYYVLDLGEKKSLLRYLVGRGFTVFVVSWKNPTAAQAETTFEDYLTKGAKQAIDVANSICGTRQAHAVGYCIGGTALATLMAWLNREHRSANAVPVAHWTLLASL